MPRRVAGPRQHEVAARDDLDEWVGKVVFYQSRTYRVDQGRAGQGRPGQGRAESRCCLTLRNMCATEFRCSSGVPSFRPPHGGTAAHEAETSHEMELHPPVLVRTGRDGRIFCLAREVINLTDTSGTAKGALGNVPHFLVMLRAQYYRPAIQCRVYGANSREQNKKIGIVNVSENSHQVLQHTR